MSTENIAIALAGAVIGAVATGAVQIYRDQQDRKARRKAVAHALRGEILAVIALSDARGYDSMATAYIDAYNGGRDTHMPSLVDPADTREAYPVAASHLADFGLLGAELAEEVASTYTTWAGIRTDLRNWAAGNLEWMRPAEKGLQVEHVWTLWQDSCERATALAEKLGKL